MISIEVFDDVQWI